MRVKSQGLCCADCQSVCANGPADDGELEHLHDMATHLGTEDLAHMVLSGNEADEEGEYSGRDCEACGRRGAGYRFPFAILEEDAR